ncbi:hypothetical protein [Natronomonas sp. EA1]|uniref:hypothetical protein n=1 Tax=Natronomonas sp. EA1 TaxID=3421655 RepID=UPI003EBC52FA
MDLRTLLAAVLGIGFGLVLIAAPEAVIRVQTAGRLPSDRRGEYGTDGTAPATWLWLLRVLGVAVLALGAYFGWQAFA